MSSPSVLPPRGSPGRRLGAIGAVLLAVLVVVAITAPWLAPYDPAIRVAEPFVRPGWPHLLGTDDVGHDILSQLIHGARVTLLVGVVAASVATLIGAGLGLAAGYVRGWVDTVVMRLVDVVLSLPFLPLMIVVGVFLGPGVGTEILVISSVMWAGAARELRSQVLSVREREHVLAAQAMGASTARILRRHVAPQVVPLVVPQFVTAAKRAILFEAALSFLGLGAGADSWGTMLFTAHARSAFLTDAWLWWVVPPGIAIAAAVLAFALVGYAVEERSRPDLERTVVSDHPVIDGTPTEERRTGQAAAAPAPRTEALLDLRDLQVIYEGRNAPAVAVDGIDLAVRRGEVVGLVGESGAGKSTVALAVAGLLHPPARRTAGTVTFDGRDLATLTGREIRRLRGDRIALVPQAAQSAMNPAFTVGDQIAEAVTLHRDVPREELAGVVATLLSQVGVDPGWRHRYPHELSGGMRQRAVIAMALANDPDLLVADEPTSGIDVVVQAEIAGLLDRLRRDRGLSLLVVSHDLPLVLGLADRVAVMQLGRVVEEGTPQQLRAEPRHPHTRDLLAAVPRLRTGGGVV